MASKTRMVVYMLTEPEPRGSNYFAYAISKEGDIHEMFIKSIGKSLAKTLATKLKKDEFFFLAKFSLKKQEECSYLWLAADKSKVKTSKSFSLPKEKVEKFFHATLCTIPDALASPKKRRLSVEGKVAKVYMNDGPTWKRCDIVLEDEGTKKRICCKLWGEHSKKITQNDTGSVVKISNVEVDVYDDKHQLNSTTLTAVEITGRQVSAKATSTIIGIDNEDGQVKDTVKMSMYNVWNGPRTIKKVVRAQNREDLICKGKVKLGIPASSSTKLVLCKEGIDVDDDDVLKQHRDKILLLLTTDEYLIEPSRAATPTPSTPTRDVEDHLSKSAVTPVSVQHVSQTEETPTSSIRKDMTSASVEMPIPEMIDLPKFSPNVVMKLQNKQSGEIFNAVLKEAAVYYHFKYPGMKTSPYYQAIGRKLVSKYPCLEYDGTRKWSYFSSQLSSRIRQLRFKEKSKTSPTICDSAESPDMPIATRCNLGRPTTGKVLSEDVFLKCCDELADEWKGQRREATIRMLMADVQPNLSSWRLGKTVKEVVARFPCLQDGGYILEELYAWIGRSNIEKGRQLIKANSKKLFRNVAEVLTDATSTMDSSLNLLQSLEKKVAVVRGKGTKSKTVFTILEVDNIYMLEDDLCRKLGVKDKAPLGLRILTIDNDIKMIYAVGEGVFFDCRTTNSLEAIVALLGGYYIFDLNYPAIYRQLLGFLQQHILEEPYTYFKGSNYQQFSNKLKYYKKEP